MSRKEHARTRACTLFVLSAAGASALAQAQAPAQSELTAAEKVEAAQTAAQQSSAQTSAVTIALIEELVKEGVISLERAKALLEAAEREAALARQRQTPPPSNAVRVPYVPESVKKQMREELRQEIAQQAKEERWGAPGALPKWLDRLEWDGDFRVRYHGEFYDAAGNFPFFPDVQAINDAGGVTTADGFPFLNSTEDRNRLRYRGRLNLTAKVAPAVRVGIGIASGEDTGPISTNETFGDYFRKDPIWIDRAFIEAKPIDSLTFTAGRILNPFVSTDLVWDPDLRLEGLALNETLSFGQAETAPALFLTAGAFPLQERAIYSDRWLYAGQLGGSLPVGPAAFTLAAAYYDFENVQSERNPPDGSRLNDYTRPLLLAQGNSVFNMRTDGLTTLAGLASEFRLLNVTAQGEYRFGDKAVRLTADYVRNLAFDAAEIDVLRGEPGVTPGDTGWQVKLFVGDQRIDTRHDWSLEVSYKRVETDAVLDAFTDSDFGEYGGTDLKGFIVEASYGLTDGTWLSLEWDSTDSISRAPFSTDLILLDLNARF